MSENETLNERSIPPAALRDEHAVEMLRVWIAERGLHCSMKVGMYRDSTNVREEKAWGKILADVARHLGEALATEQAANSNQIVSDIRSAFLEELDAPTTAVRGGFAEKAKAD